MKTDKIKWHGLVSCIFFGMMTFEPSLALGREVLTGDDFVAAYQGRWAVPYAKGPKAAAGGHDYRHTGRSPGVHTPLSDGNIKVKTHPYDIFGYALIQPPAPALGANVSMANVLGFGEMASPSFDNRPQSSGTRNHGWYIDLADNEFVSMKAYYATAGVDFASQMKNGEGFYRPTGEVVVPGIANAYHHNKVAGYICAPPVSQGERWDYMLGLSGTPGAGTSSAGISLLGVKWRIDGGTEKPFAEALIMHDYGNKQADYWDNILSIRGCAWIETVISGVPKQAIIFLANRAKGVVWYGRGDGFISSENGYLNKPADYPAAALYYTAEPTQFTVNDPYSGAKGYHSEDMERGFFIIDARKLERGNFQVYPEEWVSIDELGWLDNVNNWEGTLVEAGNRRADVTASFDAPSGKLLIAASQGYRGGRYESSPLFLQFNFPPLDYQCPLN